MSKQNIPPIIKENCLDFDWYDKKVWSLDIPVHKMSISKLSWQFNIPFWKLGHKKYVLKPQQVIDNPKKYRHHYQRIINSSLKYPIDIMQNKKGDWEILDGLHRLVKAYIQGQTTVNVRKIPKSKIPIIKR